MRAAATRGRTDGSHTACCTWPLPQIGVVGWITPTTGETSRDVGGVKFLPIVPSVRACLQELHAAHPGLHFVVGLSHSGELLLLLLLLMLPLSLSLGRASLAHA
jgi:hypothetical protein